MKDKSLNSRMWHIAIPSIIANISIPMLGLADSFIMGHLPDARYLGAIALGAMVISILYNSVNFLRMATTGFTAQAYGGRQGKEISLIYLRGCLLALGIGLFFMLIQTFVADLLLSFSTVGRDVEDLTRTYIAIRIWGAPFALMNFVAVGWLLGLHKPRQALFIQVSMNVANILLNFLFVYGFHMTVEGVAYGTILSEFGAALLSLYLINRQSRDKTGYAIWHGKNSAGFLNKAAFTKMVVLNRDIFIRTACLTGTMASFTLFGASFGKTVLAANAILMNLQMVTSFGLDGFAQAAEVLVGKEIGQRSRKKLRQAVILSSKWALITASIFSLFYFFAGPVIISLLTNIEPVRQTANSYLIWVIILPLLSVWSFQLDGIFIGATMGKSMRNSMILSVLVYILCLIFFLPSYGNHGLWLSYSIFLLMRAIGLGTEYPKIEKAAGKGRL